MRIKLGFLQIYWPTLYFPLWFGDAAIQKFTDVSWCLVNFNICRRYGIINSNRGLGIISWMVFRFTIRIKVKKNFDSSLCAMQCRYATLLVFDTIFSVAFFFLQVFSVFWYRWIISPNVYYSHIRLRSLSLCLFLFLFFF